MMLFIVLANVQQMLAGGNSDVFQLTTFSLIKPQHRLSQHKQLPALSVWNISTELETNTCEICFKLQPLWITLRHS